MFFSLSGNVDEGSSPPHAAVELWIWAAPPNPPPSLCRVSISSQQRPGWWETPTRVCFCFIFPQEILHADSFAMGAGVPWVPFAAAGTQGELPWHRPGAVVPVGPCQGLEQPSAMGNGEGGRSPVVQGLIIEIDSPLCHASIPARVHSGSPCPGDAAWHARTRVCGAHSVGQGWGFGGQPPTHQGGAGVRRLGSVLGSGEEVNACRCPQGAVCMEEPSEAPAVNILFPAMLGRKRREAAGWRRVLGRLRAQQRGV